jgi:hypothetical protein
VEELLFERGVVVTYEAIRNRHRFSSSAYRQELWTRFQVWQEITTPALAA